MTKRPANAPQTEPEESSFLNPSEGEHLFQIVDKWDDKKDPDITVVKCEVAEGEEIGRTLLQRINKNDQFKGFFYTRMFLKAIAEPYKGEFVIDDDQWIGRMFYAKVVHNLSSSGKVFANIEGYNFDKPVDQHYVTPEKNEEKAWDE